MTITHSRFNNTILYLGVFATLLFTVSITLDREINRLAEFFLVLSILLSVKNIYKYEVQNKGLWLYILIPAFLLYMAAIDYSSTISSNMEEPNHSRFSRHYLRLFLFLFFAWWIIQKPKLVWPILLIFIFTVLTQLLNSNEFWNWHAITKGYRMSFSFSNAQHTGAYAGTLILLSICLFSKISEPKSLVIKAVTFIGLVIVLGLSIFMCIYSQTRGIWLALFITLPIALTPLLMKLTIFKNISLFKGLMLYILLTIITIVTLNQIDLINKRIDLVIKELPIFINNKIEDLPNNSPGVRLKQWNLAIQFINEKPFFGYGGATKEQLIKDSSLPGPAKNAFGHFHNSYLEIAVAYGLIALCIFLTIFYVLFRKLISSIKDNTITPCLGFFGIAWLTFFLIINLFESYIMFRTGYFLLSIFGGIIYGLTSLKFEYINRECSKC